MAKSVEKRKVGRPRGSRVPFRPVLNASARVDAEIHKQVIESAREHGRTVSEEIVARVTQSFAWEKQFGTIRQLQADIERAWHGGVHQYLTQAGYTPVHGVTGTVWHEPESAVSEAVKKLLEEMKSKHIAQPPGTKS